jgi:hypothetical protein
MTAGGDNPFLLVVAKRPARGYNPWAEAKLSEPVVSVPTQYLKHRGSAPR